VDILPLRVIDTIILFHIEDGSLSIVLYPHLLLFLLVLVLLGG
jgi:hypothetical protein